jgi:PIN domain nuclease of toxin-antitoxin system
VIALLDTHVILWWLDKSTRLSAAQRKLLRRVEHGESVGVADISLWEIASLVERGRVKLGLPLDEWLARATAPPRVARVGITPAIAREMVDLSGTRNWDPADRILVATARVHGVPLVTSDSRIVDSKLVPVV